MGMSMEKNTRKKVWDEAMSADDLAALIRDEDFVNRIKEGPFFQEKYRRAVELVQKIDWSTFPCHQKKEQ
jgi:hypothetical protein